MSAVFVWVVIKNIREICVTLLAIFAVVVALGAFFYLLGVPLNLGPPDCNQAAWRSIGGCPP